MDIKDIRRQIRALRKLKRDTQKKSDARHELNRQIRELKRKIENELSTENIAPEKLSLIKEIYEREPLLKKVNVNLNKFTVAQLQKHLDRIKDKGRAI